MTTLHLKGMHCTSCEGLLTDILSDYGATQIHADFKKNLVSFQGKVPLDKVKAEIAKEGYQVLKVEA
ncbi:MAG: heavy-metal-associated domain-containing protein [Candidatus Aenigmarchaeota archaeon]|nr:heavy-metal-associated domain-containing protein [Candidatus Aenigmarchaeota archaeon]